MATTATATLTVQEWNEEPYFEYDKGKLTRASVRQDAAGDIVYVTLPDQGSTVTARTVCGEVESTKSVSDVYATGTAPTHIAIGDWNTFHIIMKGDKVTVYFNGVLVVDNTVLDNYWDYAQPIFPKEQIELQAHGTHVYYRDIYLKELPD